MLKKVTLLCVKHTKLQLFIKKVVGKEKNLLINTNFYKKLAFIGNKFEENNFFKYLKK